MEARKNAGESLPEKVFTDGLDKYKEGIAFGFAGVQKPEHIARMGVGKPHANNNRVERLNGTLREPCQGPSERMEEPREQDCRRPEVALYNFVKPHAATRRPDPRAEGGRRGEGR